MKKLKLTYILSTAAVLLAVSCTKDLTKLNENEKKPDAVVASTLFANAELAVTDVLTSTNVNLNIFRLLAQYWTETTYTDESRYNLANRNIPQNVWHALYRDVLTDLAEAKALVEADATLDAGVKKNQLAQIDIVNIYTYAVLINTFGDIPYTDALDIENLSPKYDDAHTVYLDLLDRLDVAINNLDVASESFGSSDLLYRGDVAAWEKFANALKMRLAMVIADSDPAVAKAAIEEASPNAFSSSDDDAIFEYSTIPPNTNPLWVDLVQSGRLDFVGANTTIDTMNALNDPRRQFYFNEAPGGGYKGGIYGASNSYSSFSPAGDLLRAKDFPSVWIDYMEVEFLRAEAVERGFTVGGTAMTHYNNAITASIINWGGTEAQALTYIAQPNVNYLTATGGWKGKIGVQKWLALYNRGFEAWTEWRRLDYPELVAPPRALSDIPVRYTYPVSEQNLNKINYDEAAAAIGGDDVATKLFWDMQ
ncbi:SusD/RagB family nutrient-binding outer membrane lipoprotein [Chitinophaga japonensis]|uniref:SusD/RagB-like outer membrane lipoprotein n=1 Tax=Chitinophaga japonensis TaxID=104662 RepID=A0A562TAI2_CHIJA|nr:SusD/RagB family nutrient-binding outer membrane lipoprotein [Chitinophaga japonensis]TWI90671.1 SusD/RagB-like outer membrane lipoprotein [Chitinophaga japonensis]